MKPSHLYDQDIQRHKTEEDPAQRKVLQVLDSLYDTLIVPSKKTIWPFVKKVETKGIYIYGSVGRGKTYLMDLFFQSLNIPKIRLHFYEFMSEVHVELKMLQGQVNPLNRVVENLAKNARVLCLDEFFVEDIADAMILASLLEGLFRVGMVVVTTSNVNPKDLYKEGLQRDRFFPAIELIQKHTTILDLEHPTDYRLLHDFQGKNYHEPLTHQESFLEFHFLHFKGDDMLLPNHFELEERGWESVHRTEAAIWFDFKELCAKPRAPIDYLALTEIYRAILIQNVPQFSSENEDAARRFISLVDTCYDRHVAVIMSATVPLADLYAGTRLGFEFQRTQSRLTEMAGWV